MEHCARCFTNQDFKRIAHGGNAEIFVRNNKIVKRQVRKYNELGIYAFFACEIAALQILRNCAQVIKLETFHIGSHMENGQHSELMFPLYETNLSRAVVSNMIRGKLITSVSFQVLIALMCAKSYGILHRDVKSDNILLNTNGRVVLADWGSCKSFNIRNGKSIPYSGPVQTIWIRAPECILGSNHCNSKMDVWSLACVIYFMFTGEYPAWSFCEIGQLHDYFRLFGTPNEESWSNFSQLKYYSSEFPQFPKMDTWKTVFRNKLQAQDPQNTNGEIAIDLLTGMFEMNPQKRFSLRTCYEHAFFDEFRDFFSIGSDNGFNSAGSARIFASQINLGEPAEMKLSAIGSSHRFNDHEIHTHLTAMNVLLSEVLKWKSILPDHHLPFLFFKTLELYMDKHDIHRSKILLICICLSLVSSIYFTQETKAVTFAKPMEEQIRIEMELLETIFSLSYYEILKKRNQQITDYKLITTTLLNQFFYPNHPIDLNPVMMELCNNSSNLP